MKRIPSVVTVSIVGTVVFLMWRRAVGPLLASPWLLFGCSLGAIVSTWLFCDPGARQFRSNLRPAVRIVFGTFIGIALGHAASQRWERGVAIDFEPIGIFLWAVVAASWWLIPGVALTACSVQQPVR